MDNYAALDLTARARAIAAAHPAGSTGPAPPAAAPPPEGAASPGDEPGDAIPGYGRVARRAPAAVYPEGPEGLKVAARGLGVISYGQQEIQLAAVEQVGARARGGGGRRAAAAAAAARGGTLERKRLPASRGSQCCPASRPTPSGTGCARPAPWQLVDRSQTRAVADAIKWIHARVAAGGPGGRRSLRALLEELETAMDEKVAGWFRGWGWGR
jgi:hypothetical protein